MMTLAEFPDPALPAHRHAVDTKAWVHTRFGELAEQLGAAKPGVLADQLTIIWEGTNTTAQVMGADGPPAATRALVTAILDHHTRS
jgi:hypothetical protein